MSPDDEIKCRGFGMQAANIAALCALLGDGLQHDPDTATIGEAIDGLGTLARRLSAELFDAAGERA